MTPAAFLSPAAAGFGLGVALASSPGPVQAVLLTEALRGGLRRGFRAMTGANLTFALLLFCLALGVAAVPANGGLLRAVKVVGGLFLVWLATDAIRAGELQVDAGGARPALPPAARGAVAVVLNPGVWIFLATAASSLFAAVRNGAAGSTLVAAAALVAGLVLGDGGVVLFGGLALRSRTRTFRRWVQRGLAVLLACIGVWFVLAGLR